MTASKSFLTTYARRRSNARLGRFAPPSAHDRDRRRALRFFQQPADSWTAVAEAIGRAGQAQTDGSYVVGFPKPDRRVEIRGLPMRPVLGIGSTVVFSESPEHSMVMGDVIVTEAELPAVTAKLLAGGLEITAVHNHVTGETARAACGARCAG